MAMPERKPEERKPEERRPEEERPQLRAVKREEEEEVEGREQAEQAAPTSGLALAGLVLGLASVILPAVIAVFTGIAGVVLGWMGLTQIRRGERSGTSLAWGAIVISAIVTILAIVVIAAAIF